MATASGLALVAISCALMAVAVAAGRGCAAQGWDRAAWRCGLLAAGFAALAVLGAASVAFGQSGAHGDGHAQGHDVYKHWKDRAGYSCCDSSDCRPTRAFVDDDGRWRAWNGDAWVMVPSDAVLPIPSPDMRSHLCMAPGAVEPRCFVPGPMVH